MDSDRHNTFFFFFFKVRSLAWAVPFTHIFFFSFFWHNLNPQIHQASFTNSTHVNYTLPCIIICCILKFIFWDHSFFCWWKLGPCSQCDSEWSSICNERGRTDAISQVLILKTRAWTSETRKCQARPRPARHLHFKNFRGLLSLAINDIAGQYWCHLLK